MINTQDLLPSRGPSRLNALRQMLKARSDGPTPSHRPQHQPENSTFHQNPVYQLPHTTEDSCDEDDSARMEEAGYERESQGPWEMESGNDCDMKQLRCRPNSKVVLDLIRKLEERVIALECFIPEQDEWNKRMKEATDDINKKLQGPDVPTTGRRTARTKRSSQ